MGQFPVKSICSFDALFDKTIVPSSSPALFLNLSAHKLQLTSCGLKMKCSVWVLIWLKLPKSCVGMKSTCTLVLGQSTIWQPNPHAHKLAQSNFDHRHKCLATQHKIFSSCKVLYQHHPVHHGDFIQSSVDLAKVEKISNVTATYKNMCGTKDKIKQPKTT